MQRLIIATVMCFISVFTMNAQVSTKITITIGANSFVATLYDNETAKNICGFIAAYNYNE